VLALSLTSLAPLELPELDVPSRIYARPHRIEPGQNLEASGLLWRLRRLGYRELAEGTPRPGEFRLDRRKLTLNLRPFHTPTARGEEGVVELGLSSTRRIASVRDPDGRRRTSVLLEPEVVGVFHGDRRDDRHLVPLAEFPVYLVDAVLAVEDRRFFDHGGIDLHRLVGALVVNLKAMRIVQGGSTLTQQLVKNVFLSDERTIGRKLREAWLALRVERAQSKEEILEAYLNTIYLGQRGSVSVRGMEAAARHYYGKHVRELSLGESALLAGLIRGPGLYSPFTVPDTARTRRNQVLATLREVERISDQQYLEAVELPLGTLTQAPDAVSAPYFSELVRKALQRDLPELELEQDRVDVYTSLDPNLQLIAERAVRSGLGQLEADFPRLAGEPGPLQAALVALDARTGELLAHVGGRSFRESQFDRATQAHRQPGSVFKPIVALAALRRGEDGSPSFTLASTLADEPLSVETPDGEWTPSNYDGQFSGQTNLRTAIEKSINVPVARLGLAIGPERIIQTARGLGIEAPLQPVPSLALGSFEVTPLEMAQAYAVLAAGGKRNRVTVYRSVVDVDGRELAAPEAETTQAFDPAEIGLITSILKGAIDRGTGQALRAYGFRGPVAGKTGTTNDERDAWFVGYTPELVAAVWVGFDDGRSMGLTGSRAALPIFAQFITAALGRAGGAPFERPAGLEFVDIHRPTGLRAGFGCFGDREVFLVGSAPEKRCGPSWIRSTRKDRTPDAQAKKQRARAPRWLRVLDRLLDAID
jgi:penicillin-binding protein 1B